MPEVSSVSGLGAAMGVRISSMRACSANSGFSASRVALSRMTVPLTVDRLSRHSRAAGLLEGCPTWPLSADPDRRTMVRPSASTTPAKSICISRASAPSRSATYPVSPRETASRQLLSWAAICRASLRRISTLL